MLGCLMGLVWCIMTMWCWASSAPWWMRVCAGTLLVLSTWGLLSLFRVRPFSLRWDTQVWGFGRAEQRGHEPCSGYVAVAIDLGFWMLLRFAPTASSLGRHQWLPVQRRGHEQMWHAFRATVHGAVPTCRI